MSEDEGNVVVKAEEEKVVDMTLNEDEKPLDPLIGVEGQQAFADNEIHDVDGDDDEDEDEDDEKDNKDEDASDSGKESVQSDESSFHASDYENDSGYDPDKDPSELLLIAQEFKEKGNDFFQTNGDLVRASRCYKKGISVLKPMLRDHDSHNMDEQQLETQKSLMVTLSNNLSMLSLQQGKPKLSVDVASKAIAVDSTNAKAYYRRAMGYKKLGLLKEAKKDLKAAYTHDPSNKTVQKELHALVKYLHDSHQRQKKAAQAVFSFHNKSTCLYDDKLEEERKKKEAEELKKREEEAMLAKRKMDWEADCAQRRSAAAASGDDSPAVVLSYEEWDKERKKKEKAARKARKENERRLLAEEQEQKRKAKEMARTVKSAKSQEKDIEADDDDDKLTESELAQFRGYKKTRDGAVTSYFTREPSDHEIKLIGDITPQRLDPNGDTVGLNAATSAVTTATGKGKASAWNASGTTWEEKDATDWATTQLRFRLMESVAVDDSPPILAVKITDVSTLTGDASVAIASGRKRYIFYFHADLEFEINEGSHDGDGENVVGSGVLRLPDVNSGNHQDFDIDVCEWKIQPSEDQLAKATKLREALVNAVRVSVLNFVEDFNGHY